MNKLIILFVTIFGLFVLLSSGCNSTNSASKDIGWIELNLVESGYEGLINPNDYK
jgi:predicted component of type VI protein secretion system